MHQHLDSELLSDVATILLDCGLRPEECFRLRAENVRDGKIEVQYGKTDNARRRIPNDRARQGDPGTPTLRQLGFPRADAERSYRALQPEKTARQSDPGGYENPPQAGRPRRRDLPGIRAVHSTPHVPDSLGAAYGPVDARLRRRPSRHEHHQALRPSAGADHPRCHGSRARSRGWAYFRAYRPACLAGESRAGNTTD